MIGQTLKQYEIEDVLGKGGMNRKLFFGEPIVATVRDDVAPAEFRRMIKEPGLLCVREDVFDNPQYGAS